MNSPYIAALLQAYALLPQCGRRSYGKLLCVLVFVKVWSASWRSQAAKWQGYAHAKKAIAMATAWQLAMTEQTLLDALLPADANNILSLEAAQDLIPRLCAASNTIMNSTGEDMTASFTDHPTFQIEHDILTNENTR